MTFDLTGLTEKRNKAGVKYLENRLNEVVAKECTKCLEMKLLSSFAKKIPGFADRKSSCRDCLRLHRMSSRLRRRDKQYGVVSRVTDEDIKKVLGNFDYKCPLTGSEDFHIDHVIPVSLGIVGGEYGNIIPLKEDLNLVKGNSNIFEWFADNRERFGLSQRKFDELIEYLADINEMTIEEYEEYVRWCHDNPRTIDEIKAEETSNDDAS